MSRFLITALFIAGCGGGTSPGGADAVDSCGLDVTNLAGKTFVMYEAMADKSYKENQMARVRFSEEGGVTKAKYTIKHPVHVYDYDCTVYTPEDGGDTELRCFEEEKPEDWCASLQAHEWGSCTSKKLGQLGAHGTEAELKAAVRQAKKDARAVKEEGEDVFKRWQLMNNNLGNHLQNRLYIKRDKRECRLSFADMYFTIYNGKGKEDTNPVGINPFVETTTDYMFEHCEGKLNMAPYDKAKPPEDKDFGDPRAKKKAGDDIYYHYLGADAVKAEEGCTYSMDTFSQYKAQESGIPVTPGEKDVLHWVGKTSYPADDLIRQDNLELGIFVMKRFKECAGKKEYIDTVCALNFME
ncbi:MAG: hypothetical protein ACI8PZ_002837 [Myxococcota bacterium]|jgi:hypothetical protein